MKTDAPKIVSLAIEILECTMKALDASRDQFSGSGGAGRYTARDWAMDVLQRLPDDRETAQLIFDAHRETGQSWAERRKLGRLCSGYYNSLDSAGLLKHGQRLLKTRD
jgi:hypothetical protein